MTCRAIKKIPRENIDTKEKIPKIPLTSFCVIHLVVGYGF